MVLFQEPAEPRSWHNRPEYGPYSGTIGGAPPSEPPNKPVRTAGPILFTDLVYEADGSGAVEPSQTPSLLDDEFEAPIPEIDWNELADQYEKEQAKK